MALLTADNPGVERVAMTLARLGGAGVRREAGRRLVALARAAAQREPPPVDEDGALPVPDPDAREAQRTEAMEPLLAAMSHLGGPEVTDYAFALAEDEAAPVERRRLAAKVLLVALPESDGPGQARRTLDAARLASLPRAFDRPTDAVPYLARAARACARRDPAIAGTARLTVRFHRRGNTTSRVEGSAPADVQACLVTAANRLRFSAMVESGAELVIPFTFVPPLR